MKKSRKAAKAAKPPAAKSSKTQEQKAHDSPQPVAQPGKMYALRSRWVFQGPDADNPPAEVNVETLLDAEPILVENKRIAIERDLLRKMYDEVAGRHVALLREWAALARIVAEYREQAARDVAKTTTTGLLELAT